MAPISNLTQQARRDNINPVRGRRPYSVRGIANPYAPPLQATGTNSRTYGLLRYEIRGESVWYYWGVDSDTGLDWGIILARHAGGFWQRFVYPRQSFGFVKPRDVIGLSNQDMRDIAQEMGRWWLANRKRFAGRDMPEIRPTASGVSVPQRADDRPWINFGFDKRRATLTPMVGRQVTTARGRDVGQRVRGGLQPIPDVGTLPPPASPSPRRTPPRPPAPAVARIAKVPPVPVLVGVGDNRRVSRPWLNWLLLAVGLGALAGLVKASSKDDE